MSILIMAIIASTLRLATPLIFSAIGGVFSERAGVVNIALEGIMIMGAFFSILSMHFFNSPWLAVLVAILAGIITSLLLGVLAIHLRANQVVAGVAINLLAASLTSYLLVMVWKRSGQTDSVASNLTVNPFPVLAKIPVIGVLFDGLTPFVYLALITVAIAYYVIFKTPFGLRLRSVGEHPAAADTLGINVYKTRYIAVMISGALAGLSGAALSLGTVNLFRNGMTSGKGFIALAAMIFGKWHPVGALLACLFFGLAEAVQIQAASLGLSWIPSEFLQMLPYIATILALAGVVGKSVAPAADGEPYEKGHR
ncbi:ABC transporter permease [Helicovermis profundi]|uniref:ABC transporter permease n=1 Tax=Helicovermis profundi TaxID=3065157 RepID=A0AAU9EN60_9FIRM|nr:ABC transporter permease [Clostridia bacterium S502]